MEREEFIDKDCDKEVRATHFGTGERGGVRDREGRSRREKGEEVP